MGPTSPKYSRSDKDLQAVLFFPIQHSFCSNQFAQVLGIKRQGLEASVEGETGVAGAVVCWAARLAVARARPLLEPWATGA